jgi:alkylation response protein AidB-like acyl-CoA dehydrogenase
MSNVAPVLRDYGTRYQQQRFLRPAFAGIDVWCQLMSEPGAGSDVASLATRAERDGDAWVVNGQKVWTGFAYTASYGLLVARTNPDLPKHTGITCFVVDMHAPGVEVRPLRQMTGRAEFNEVFLTDVVVPDAMRVGPVERGWDVISSNLQGERLAFVGGEGGEARRSTEVLARWRDEPATPAFRVRMAAMYERLLALDLTVERAAELRAREDASLHPSGLKLLGTEVGVALAELELERLGVAGSLMPSSYPDGSPEVEFNHGDTVQERFLRTRANTIEGGTSEVNRNVVAERQLGLPREPRDDVGRPWSEVPR